MKIMAGVTVTVVIALSGSSKAATIQATDFLYAAGGGTYDGTASNPWPQAALQAAIASVQGGDVVVLANGTWSITSPFQTTNGDFTLEGQAADETTPPNSARIVFSPSSYWIFGSLYTLTNNVKITGLTLDGSPVTGYNNPMWVLNCASCTVAGNVVLGTSNSSVATLLFSGGVNNRIAGNTVLAGSTSGGAQLQVNAQALPGSLPINSGYDIDGNYFDSSNLLVIGISDVHIHGNTFVDTTLHNFITILFVAQSGGITRNIVIDSNVLDTYIPGYGWGNDAAITGVSTGLTQGAVYGLVIANNAIQSLISTIAVNCLNGCGSDTTAPKTYYSVITNNMLHSGGQGSLIDLRGGTYGAVGTATVQGNILMTDTSGVTPNQILTDANTSTANEGNNLLGP